MKNITATYKGVLTGVIMMASAFIYFAKFKEFEWQMQYLLYGLYIAGIVWTLLSFKQKNGGAKFKEYFQEGFKCFIVVTLLMVLFTLVFIKMHPELMTQMEASIRAEALTNKEMMPADIDKTVSNAKSAYMPMHLMGAILVYLFIGALVTAIASGFLSQKAIAK